MKKAISLVLSLILALSLAACGEKEVVPDPDVEYEGGFDPVMKVILIIDENGFGDNGYNDMCLAGVERAQTELGVDIDIDYVQAGSYDTYDVYIEEVVNMEPDLIICTNSSMAVPVKNAARIYPAQAFAIIDGADLGSNVRGCVFNAEQGSFIAGLLAGMLTENNVVSFIGGMVSEAQYKYQYGFQAGVSTISDQIQVAVGWLDSYIDTNLAKEVAVAHKVLGSDIIYQSAGKAGEGVVAAGAERGFYVIGTGVDMSYIDENAILCTVAKRADIAAYDAVADFIDGTFFEKGDVVYSLENGGVEIANLAVELDETQAGILERHMEMIKSGTFEVPYNWTTWYEYSSRIQAERAGEAAAAEAEETSEEETGEEAE